MTNKYLIVKELVAELNVPKHQYNGFKSWLYTNRAQLDTRVCLNNSSNLLYSLESVQALYPERTTRRYAHKADTNVSRRQLAKAIRHTRKAERLCTKATSECLVALFDIAVHREGVKHYHGNTQRAYRGSLFCLWLTVIILIVHDLVTYFI